MHTELFILAVGVDSQILCGWLVQYPDQLPIVGLDSAGRIIFLQLQDFLQIQQKKHSHICYETHTSALSSRLVKRKVNHIDSEPRAERPAMQLQTSHDQYPQFACRIRPNFRKEHGQQEHSQCNQMPLTCQSRTGTSLDTQALGLIAGDYSSCFYFPPSSGYWLPVRRLAIKKARRG